MHRLGILDHLFDLVFKEHKASGRGFHASPPISVLSERADVHPEISGKFVVRDRSAQDTSQTLGSEKNGFIKGFHAHPVTSVALR